MKLTVPTNWEGDLVRSVKKPYVDTIYGKLDRDVVGGGRASCVLLKVKKGHAESHIKEIHKEKLKFYYILNASCLGNKEWTKKGQEQITSLLDWLSGLSVDGVIVTSPYLLQIIKKRYSQFDISVSCFANVNSVEKARFWQDLGASTITLSQVEANRNFKLLEEIRKNVDCQLQLIANDSCISDCPIFFYHNNTSSHSSQSGNSLNNFMFDYCYLTCKYRKFNNLINFIRATWIRPEDLKVYEDIGINRFKLTDRTMDTKYLSRIVEAYSGRSYQGNLYDLIITPSKSSWSRKVSLFHKFKYFFHPLSINLIKYVKSIKLLRYVDVFIDNRKLDGFINHFLTSDCRLRSCKTCGYCQEVADRVIEIKDHQAYEKSLADYRVFLDMITSGDMFKY